MLDNITLTGITPLENYPDCCSNKNCKQNIQQLSLSIPCQKPEMESINDIKITLCIKAFKILNTILGRKVLINGVSKVKAIYTAKNKEQSLHSAHFTVPFSTFIIVEKDTPLSQKFRILPFIEDVFACMLAERSVFKNTTIFLKASKVC